MAAPKQQLLAAVILIVAVGAAHAQVCIRNSPGSATANSFSKCHVSVLGQQIHVNKGQRGNGG